MSEQMEPKVLQGRDECEHLWLDYEPGPCPACAEIKAAEDKRGREVLELAMKSKGNVSPWIEETVPRIMDAINGGTSESIADIIHQELYNAAEVGRRRHSTTFRQAYQERFGK